MRLGTLLLRDAVITLSQLEAALRTQVLYGGRVGTNLVELGFLDVNTLGRYLARLHDVPLAAPERFEAVDRATLDQFGADRAERFLAYPLGHEQGARDSIGVAMVAPNQDADVEQLRRELGCSIRAYCAAELRILYYIERGYGIQRKGRYLRTGDGALPRGRERRSSQPLRGIVPAEPIRFEPRKKESAANTADGSEPVVSLDEARGRIESANHRDEIASALLDYTVGRVGAAALLIVRGQNAVGWCAQPPQDDIERLTLPLGGSSVVQAALDSGKPYRGGATSAGRPVERVLWTSLGALDVEPEDMLVVPVLVRGRTVNLLYGHEPFARGVDDGLADLAAAAGEAYLRLIAQSKASS